MKLISVRMLRKRRPFQPPARQQPPTFPPPPPPPAPSAATTTTTTTANSDTSAPPTTTAPALAFTAAFPPIQEDRTLVFSPQAAFVPPAPASPTPAGPLEHQAASSSAASEPVLDAQGSAMYQQYPSQESTASSLSPGKSPKRAGSVSPPVLPMPSQSVSRFSPSPPPMRGKSVA